MPDYSNRRRSKSITMITGRPRGWYQQPSWRSTKKVFGRREFDLESMVEAIDAVDYLAADEEELYIAISNVMTDFAVVPDMYYFNWLKKNLIKPPSSKPSKPSKKWIQKKK